MYSKKGYVIICLVILSALLITGCLPTTTVTTPEMYFTFDSTTGTITGYDIAGGLDVFIPSTIDGVIVEHIGLDAFKEKYLTSVIIPDSVTSIGNCAFRINQLTSVTIPDSVTSIVYWVFASNQLSSVIIGSDVDINSDPATMGTNTGFKTVYDGGGKLAGTYNYTGGVWVKVWAASMLITGITVTGAGNATEVVNTQK